MRPVMAVSRRGALSGTGVHSRSHEDLTGGVLQGGPGRLPRARRCVTGMTRKLTC